MSQKDTPEWGRDAHSSNLQRNATHPETFAPHVISLTSEQYRSTVKALTLPYRGIESTSCVGPSFWGAWNEDDETPHLRMSFFQLSDRYLSCNNFNTNSLSQKQPSVQKFYQWLGAPTLTQHQQQHHNWILQRNPQL